MSIFTNGTGKDRAALVADRPRGAAGIAPSPPPLVEAETWQGIYPGIGSALREEATTRARTLTEGDGPMSAKAPMSTKVIVLVSDEKDANHWEVTVVDGAREAERLLESLLERGADHDSIRVFTGAEIGMNVTYKPVVAFAGERQDWTGTDEGGEPHREVPVARPDAISEDLRAADIPARDGTGAPVRFSSLFRPVGDPPAFCGAGDVEDPIEELAPA